MPWQLWPCGASLVFWKRDNYELLDLDSDQILLHILTSSVTSSRTMTSVWETWVSWNWYPLGGSMMNLGLRKLKSPVLKDSTVFGSHCFTTRVMTKRGRISTCWIWQEILDYIPANSARNRSIVTVTTQVLENISVGCRTTPFFVLHYDFHQISQTKLTRSPFMRWVGIDLLLASWTGTWPGVSCEVQHFEIPLHRTLATLLNQWHPKTGVW